MPVGNAVVGMSAGTIWQKRFAGDGDLLAGACWQYAGGGWLRRFSPPPSRASVSRRRANWCWPWLVLVLSIGAIFLLMLMIRDGAMAEVAPFFYLVPAVTALIAWPVFGGALSLAQIGGVALATFGVAVGARRGPAARPAA